MSTYGMQKVYKVVRVVEHNGAKLLLSFQSKTLNPDLTVEYKVGEKAEPRVGGAYLTAFTNLAAAKKFVNLRKNRRQNPEFMVYEGTGDVVLALEEGDNRVNSDYVDGQRARVAWALAKVTKVEFRHAMQELGVNAADAFKEFHDGTVACASITLEKLVYPREVVTITYAWDDEPTPVAVAADPADFADDYDDSDDDDSWDDEDDQDEDYPY